MKRHTIALAILLAGLAAAAWVFAQDEPPPIGEIVPQREFEPYPVGPSINAAYFELTPDLMRAVFAIPSDVQIIRMTVDTPLRFDGTPTLRIVVQGDSLPRVHRDGTLPKLHPPVYQDSTGTVRVWGWRSADDAWWKTAERLRGEWRSAE